MLDRHTLDDLIYGSGECLLTEDEVVAYVRRADPKYQGWDDWPLRMTSRINSFLRANGSNPELTCDQAFFFFQGRTRRDYLTCRPPPPNLNKQKSALQSAFTGSQPLHIHWRESHFNEAEKTTARTREK